MTYDFDKVIDRRGTGSVRWDTVVSKFGEPDLIPLTTADMDFQVAEPLREALRRIVDLGVYGYTRHTEGFYRAIVDRFREKWNWEIRRDWIVHSPTVIAAIAFCIQGMTGPGDGVVLPTPMYHPFQHIIRDNGRKLLECPMKEERGRYVLDLEDLEAKLKAPGTRMLLFCNPHNPVGRAWTSEELELVCRLCIENDVILISDEIHCDFMFDGRRFVSAAAPMEKLGGLDKLIVCSSAGKSFNVAGLQAANIVIPGDGLREKYDRVMKCQSFHELNMMGTAAVEAAYTRCGEWQEQVIAYLEGTRDRLVDYIRENIPGIVPIVPEATYMIWLDCRGLGLDAAALEDLFTHKAKVGVNMGGIFGPGGDGFVRINFASPRATITEALKRIENAVRSL